MPNVPGLRSCYAKVGRFVYFGRMLDKIRLHAAGLLPAEYVTNLGEGQGFFFDGRCCRFLGVPYEELKARTLQGGTDEEILAWVESRGQRRSDDDCMIWNRFMSKIGWRDDRAAILRDRIAKLGLTQYQLETGFDYIDYDEGRDPAAERAWEKI